MENFIFCAVYCLNHLTNQAGSLFCDLIDFICDHKLFKVINKNYFDAADSLITIPQSINYGAKVKILTKLQADPCNFIKKRFWHSCFPVNFEKFLK